jgi:hypothetical protein
MRETCDSQSSIDRRQARIEHDLRDVNLNTEATPLSEEIVKRLSDSAARLNDVASKIEDHGNRLFGPRPEAGCGSGDGGENISKRVEPQGIVDYLYIALASVDDAIARTASAHARISRV